MPPSSASAAARQLWQGSVWPEWSAEFLTDAFATASRLNGAEGDEGEPRAVVIRRNAWRPKPGADGVSAGSVGFAIVSFRSAAEAARTHERLDGRPIPVAAAEGGVEAPVFFLRKFAETLRTTVNHHAAADAEAADADDASGGGGAAAEVTLAEQLAPLDTDELRRRLASLGHWCGGAG